MGMADEDPLEQAFALELGPNASDRGLWSPHHHPDEVATETARAGAAVAADLARSRQLHGGWRWSAEQKRLRAQVKAQQQVGRELGQLEHSGARVLHARRAPYTAQPLDHIVIARNGIFVVVDLLSTSRQPVTWTSDHHLQAAGWGLDRFEQGVKDSNDAVVDATHDLLGTGWSIASTALIAVSGVWPSAALANTADLLGVGTAAAVRAAIAGPGMPVRFDATDVAVIANAVARACPNAV